MTDDLSKKLHDIARRVPDRDIKKLIKSFVPSGEIRFPEGRVNLKTHKPGVTHTHCPVRPIVSNTNAPTAPLASYLGHTLTKNLGKVSGKHIGSVEQFAARMRDCTTDGRLILLDVVNLFSCVPVPEVIRSYETNRMAGVTHRLPMLPQLDHLYMISVWIVSCFVIF